MDGWIDRYSPPIAPFPHRKYDRPSRSVADAVDEECARCETGRTFDWSILKKRVAHSGKVFKRSRHANGIEAPSAPDTLIECEDRCVSVFDGIARVSKSI